MASRQAGRAGRTLRRPEAGLPQRPSGDESLLREHSLALPLKSKLNASPRLAPFLPLWGE